MWGLSGLLISRQIVGADHNKPHVAAANRKQLLQSTERSRAVPTLPTLLEICVVSDQCKVFCAAVIKVDGGSTISVWLERDQLRYVMLAPIPFEILLRVIHLVTGRTGEVQHHQSVQPGLRSRSD